MNLKEIINSLRGSDNQKTGRCVSCNALFDKSNVATEQGWTETEISRLCEVCFDNATYDFNMNVLDPSIVTLVRTNKNLVLAGGSLRKTVDPHDVICDYDLFVLDQEIIDDIRCQLEDMGFNNVFTCPEGKLYTYKLEDLKVQLINNRLYQDMYDIISSFDITACCAVWDGDRLLRNDRFVFDVLNKRINLNTVEYPKATLNRIIKYVGKGYTLTREANEFFVNSVNEIELDDENSRFYID